MTCMGRTQAVWAAGGKHTYTHTHHDLTALFSLPSFTASLNPVVTIFLLLIYSFHTAHVPVPLSKCLLMATFIGNTSLLRSLEGRLFE